MKTQQWAKEYMRRGYAIARIRENQKRPTDKGWTTRSAHPDEFRESDNLGIMCGRLSQDLVCIDIDNHAVLEDADAFLPTTDMVEGRPGKPASHRYYHVINILPDYVATCAGNIGGPRTVQFSSSGMLVEFRGTGSQAVAPASIWSKDGRRERREWACFGEPATVEHAELLEATAKLAAAHGWRKRTLHRKVSRCPLPAYMPELTMPTGDVARRARAYLRKMRAAVQRKGGSSTMFTAACLLVRDFALPVEQALPILLEYNQRAEPPFSYPEILWKLQQADKFEGERGEKAAVRRVEVCVPDGATQVVVGVGCRGMMSHIDLPSLYHGLYDEKPIHEIAAVNWAGKTALLAPTSCITTNRHETRAEYLLARELRKLGATVLAYRLPHDGRRHTLADFTDEMMLVEPPRTEEEAREAEAAASEKARLSGSQRTSITRNKNSPATDRAVAFLIRERVMKVTKEVVQKAAEEGIKRRTLYLALSSLLKAE